MGTIAFDQQTGATPATEAFTLGEIGAVQGKSVAPDPTRPNRPYPKAFAEGIGEEKRKDVTRWLGEALEKLKTQQQDKLDEWANYEIAYRALPEAPKSVPFKGASNDVVPAIAMGVDPIVARLDVGIFKQDPVFTLKALKKSTVEYIDALGVWVNFVQRHQWKLRRVASPRFNEFCKLGTMVFKTVFDRVEHDIVTYDQDYKVTKKKEVLYSGARVLGVKLENLLFGPGYEDINDCPIVAERLPTTYGRLMQMEKSGKLEGVKKVKNYNATKQDNSLEETRAVAANHQETGVPDLSDMNVWEIWFEYDIDDDDIPERMVAYYHAESQTLLSLRYNWYFHQRVPYTVIPYTRANDSLYGIGMCEMCLPFQVSLTRWHQMSQDNAYLANTRMYIAKKNSGIEEVPRLYAGRTFFVDDPSSDFKPFQAGEIYPSTLTERQNLFGLMEKRTGVSDYLTGRESPIVGSRATATSTVALIQEGTKRVEQVMENIREGFADMLEKAFSIWIQYGLEGLDDLVFGDDDTGKKVKAFFDAHSARNVNGAIGIDLSATDASASKGVMQQVQLQIIQVMMQYLEKLLAAGQGALAAQQQMPQFSAMVGEVMTAARKMFKDFLVKHDIKNADELLPDLERFLNAGAPEPTVAGGIGVPSGGSGGPPDLQGVAANQGAPTGPGGAGNPLLPFLA